VALWAPAAWAQGFGYVVDNARAQVGVISLRPPGLAATIPTGSQSSEILILPNNRIAFVSNQTENNVAVLDLELNRRLTTIPVGQGPGSLVASPEGRFLYVANEGSNDVTVINTATQTAVARITVGATPVQVNLSPSGQTLYAVNQDDATISVIDAARNTVVRTVPVGQRPVQIAVAANRNIAYVVNNDSGTLSLFDLATNSVTGSIPVGRRPSTAAFAPNGRRLYVANRDSNSISVIDTQQNRQVTQIAVGPQPADIAITFDSLYAYVSNLGSNTVTLLDLATNTNEDNITVGNAPFSLQLDPNEDFLFVTNLGSGTVSVLDVNVDRVVATVGLGSGAAPVQFAFLNAPTLLSLSPNPAPAGSVITLRGEGFLRNSVVRFVTVAPPQTLTPAVTFVDSETLRVQAPSFNGPRATVSVANPDGNSSEELTFQIGAAPPSVVISSGGVVEGAGFQPAPYPISGGSIVSVFGAFPGVVQQTAGGFPLPTTLGNATVSFNGGAAPLIFAGPSQINLVAPMGLLGLSSAQVTVSVSGQASAPATVNVAPAAPGIFTLPALGGGAAVTHADGSVVTSTNPAQRGETLVLYVTGLGNTNPPPLDGQPARSDVLSPTTTAPTVAVGGTPATVRFSGLTPGFSGLYQINFDVPLATPSGAASVTVTSLGRTSNSVSLVVR
jgi:uncharacterized protein (TIGR03437 family)